MSPLERSTSNIVLIDHPVEKSYKACLVHAFFCTNVKDCRLFTPGQDRAGALIISILVIYLEVASAPWVRMQLLSVISVVTEAGFGNDSEIITFPHPAAGEGGPQWPAGEPGGGPPTVAGNPPIRPLGPPRWPAIPIPSLGAKRLASYTIYWNHAHFFF